MAIDLIYKLDKSFLVELLRNHGTIHHSDDATKPVVNWFKEMFTAVSGVITVHAKL